MNVSFYLVKLLFFPPEIFRGFNANAESGEVDKEGGQQDR